MWLCCRVLGEQRTIRRAGTAVIGTAKLNLYRVVCYSLGLFHWVNVVTWWFTSPSRPFSWMTIEPACDRGLVLFCFNRKYVFCWHHMNIVQREIVTPAKPGRWRHGVDTDGRHYLVLMLLSLNTFSSLQATAVDNWDVDGAQAPLLITLLDRAVTLGPSEPTPWAWPKTAKAYGTDPRPSASEHDVNNQNIWGKRMLVNSNGLKKIRGIILSVLMF